MPKAFLAANPAGPANANSLDPSPYGVFYTSDSQRADRLFVFVTRAGRVVARHADGTVRDVACPACSAGGAQAL